MPLTIGATPFSPWRVLEPLLRHLTWNGGETSANELPLNETSPEPRLLLHSRPEWAIAQALDQGEAPEQALTTWQSEAEALLNHFKSQRSHAAMVEIHSAVQHPKQLLDWLARHHGAFKDLARPFPKGKAPSLTQPERPSEFSLLIATQMVAQTPKLAPLMAQLEACSIPLGEDHYPAAKVDINAVAAQKQAEAADSQEVADLKDENDLLLKQLFQVQEKLEAENKQVHQLSDEVDALNKKIQKGLKIENDKVLRQLTSVQSELAHYHSQNKALASQLEDTRSALERSENEGSRLAAKVSALESDNERARETVEALRGQLSSFGLGGFGSHWFGLKAGARWVARLFSRKSRRVRSHVKLIKNSELFDAAWYVARNPDVASQYPDPAEHYVRHGGAEGRAPSPQFDAKTYLKKYPDVAEAGQNPLVHYLLHGKAEGRKI